MSDEKNEISKVPPPIEPLSGSSSPPLIWHKPDWDFWKHKTKIKLWEAAFLCCDIDPSNQDYRDIKGRHYEKVDTYLDLLKDNLNRLDFDFVNLPEVAEWAFSKDLDIHIPKELAALAKKPDAAPVTKEENKQTLPDPIKSIEGKEIRGVPKKEIINSFRGIHYLTDNNWSKALASPPDWLKRYRVEIGRKGSKTKSAIWNPVCIAIELYEREVLINKFDQIPKRHISIANLNEIFSDWDDWVEEWHNKSSSLLD